MINKLTNNVVGPSIYEFKRQVANSRSLVQSYRMSHKGPLPVTVAGPQLHVISPEITRASLGRLSSAKVKSSIKLDSRTTARQGFEGGRSSQKRLSKPD